MATKFDRVMDILASVDPGVSNDLIMSRFEARNDGETVSMETIRKARIQFDAMVADAEAEADAADAYDQAVAERAAEDEITYDEASGEYFDGTGEQLSDGGVLIDNDDPETEIMDVDENGNERPFDSVEPEATTGAPEATDDAEIVYTTDDGTPVETEDPSYVEVVEDIEDGPVEGEAEFTEPVFGEPKTSEQHASVYNNGITVPEGQSEQKPEPVSTITREPVEGRCNHRMERAGDLCGRPLGHPGVHTTFTQMDKKKNYSKDHAKDRYHSDPAYAARVKEASRKSHQKARDEAKALKAESAARAAAEEAAATTE